MLNNSIIELLPDDLLSVIKPCLKETCLGGGSQKIGMTSDPLFILSEQEIFGRKIYSIGGEGKWYDWYRQENTEYGKCKQNGERDWRWERSPSSDNTTVFAVCTPRALPAITAPATLMACPSASAFNPKSRIIPPRKGR